MDSKKVAEFYDEFSSNQQKLAYNERHFLMIEKLLKNGMNNSSSVLELGCGIGVITKLISTFNKKGHITSVDISPKNIDLAKKTNKDSKNIDFITEDITALKLSNKYDFICLFDVLEHIPVLLHEKLFATIRNCSHENTTILINIPNPDCLKYYKINHPDVLQIIEECIYPKDILRLCELNNLEVMQYEKYNLFLKNESCFYLLNVHSEWKQVNIEISTKKIENRYRIKKLKNIIFK